MTTPDVTFTVDRLGRQITAGSSISAHEFAYSGLLLDTETIVSGGGTNVIDRSYDGYGRSTGFTLGGDYSATYGYDALGRFSSISSSVQSASSVVNYSYLPNSDLITTVAGVGDPGLSVSRSYEDHRNLLTQIDNKVGATSVSRFDYSNDAVGRRIQRVDFGGTTNTFGYNTRSEVTSALMSTNVYGYQYDPIGNRIWAIANVESNDYTANALNQYTQIADGITNILAYDFDGNATNNGTWTYTWDGENRLIGAANESTVASYAYDYMSRRSQKVVNGVTNTFLYDGWNLIKEISSTGITNVYTWGIDLSGSLQGAGGIGGLQSVTRNGETYYPTYDANGNITDYVATNGTVVAHREYDAFGNTLVATGTMVNDFHFWFSTKYLDQETGLYYYGYRYYDPVTGRWLSRDPIGEIGGDNCYRYVDNQPVSRIDLFGLWSTDIHEVATKRWAVALGYPDAAAGAIGKADEAVDGGAVGGGTGWAPWGDQSYHFDRNKGVGKDTRIKHYEDHLKLAKEACTKPKDDPDTAAGQLGTSLHPYQDWVAHGDYGFTDDGAIWFDGVHNKHSPQATTWGAVSSYPDNPILDAVGGPNGRPAAPAMQTITINLGVSVREYAIYKRGTERLRLTKSMTDGVLQDFRTHVRQNGIPNCKCWKYFGISSTP